MLPINCFLEAKYLIFIIFKMLLNTVISRVFYNTVVSGTQCFSTNSTNIVIVSHEYPQISTIHS